MNGKTLTLVGIAGLCTLVAFGQAAEEVAPEPIREISNRAAAAPPAFAADLLIRLAGLQESPASVRKDWLEKAFAFAQSAPLQEVDLSDVFNQLYLARAIAAGRSRPNVALSGPNEAIATAVYRKPAVPLEPLDAFHLRTRAVEGMLSLDPARAMELFRLVTPPDPSGIPCDESVPSDSSAYYRLAVRLFLTGFSSEDREDGRDVDFLVYVILAARSANDLAPITRLLPGIADDSSFTRLTGAIAASLPQMRPPRSPEQYQLDMQVLTSEMRKRRVSPFPLMTAYRHYLVDAIRGAKCDPLTGRGQSLPFSAQHFNETILRYGGDQTAQIQPIALDELERKKSTPSAVITHPLPDRVGTLSLRAEVLRAATEEQRKKPEWEVALRELLIATDEWLGDPRESEKVPELAKLMFLASMYDQLAAITPQRDLRRNLLSRQIAALKGSPVRGQEPRAWLLSAARLLSPKHLEEEDQVWVRAELRVADPVLALYSDVFGQFGKR